MSASHALYGLRVTANQALPGIPVQSDSEPFDLRIRLNEEGRIPAELALACNRLQSDGGASDYDDLRTSVLAGGEYFGFFYGDGARFAVECRGREVWADWPDNYPLEDGCTYLLGPVMGFVLRLRGIVCLHASAVAIGDRAIALVGLPGAGKSTTAAAFAHAGFSVLSDDVVPLTDRGEQFLIQPGYPRVNLWPDSVRNLLGSENALPCITPTWDKRYLTLGQNGLRFASGPLPLGAIYMLDGRDEALSAPVIEELSSKEALLILIANTYVNYLLDRNMRRTEFEVLSRIVSGTPVHRVRAPDKPSAIFDLCEAIANDARRVMAPVPTNATSVLG